MTYYRSDSTGQYYETYCSDLKSDDTVRSLVDPQSKQVTFKVPNFDMGTTWGSSKESKVTRVEFERGSMIYSGDIYYASRKSLIDAGVIGKNGQQVSFPSSFPKYASPPPGWRG